MTAIQLVNGYNGFGVHTFLSIIRSFPGLYKNFIFVSVAEVDVGSFKGSDAVSNPENLHGCDLGKYVDLARKLGLRRGLPVRPRDRHRPDGRRTSARRRRKEFPKSTVFAGQSVFRQPNLIHRLLHNETAFAIQQELRWKGITAVILPIRINI